MSDHDTEFGLYDPTQEVSRSDRNLPHWFQPGVAVFETFRARDSLPRHVVQGWEAQLSDWLSAAGVKRGPDGEPASLTPRQLREFQRLKERLLHYSLDRCHGACRLRDPRAAAIVGDALLFFDGDRYSVDSFVVMPNHVHLLVQFRPPTTLSEQRTSWFRYTV